MRTVIVREVLATALVGVGLGTLLLFAPFACNPQGPELPKPIPTPNINYIDGPIGGISPAPSHQ